MTIYNVGVAILDIIFENSQPTRTNIGGSLLNTAVSLTRMGHPVKFVSALAKDEISKMFTIFMTENGMDTSLVTRDAPESIVALAFLAESTKYEFRGEIPY